MAILAANELTDLQRTAVKQCTASERRGRHLGLLGTIVDPVSNSVSSTESMSLAVTECLIQSSAYLLHDCSVIPHHITA